MVDKSDTSTPDGYRHYGCVTRRLAHEALSMPGVICVSCMLTAVIFTTQIAIALLLMQVLDTDAAPGFLSKWSDLMDTLAVPLEMIWIVIIGLLIARLACNASADGLRLRARKQTEIRLSQSYVDNLANTSAGASDVQAHLLESGPGVMTRGANMSGIVSAQMTHVLAKLPFMIIYLIFLIILFPRASLYGVAPFFLALIAMVILSVQFRTLSSLYAESTAAAVTTRKAFWQALKTKTDISEQPELIIASGETGAQIDHFYARHSRSVLINFIVAALIVLAIAASLYGFTQSVEHGDRQWPDVIILLAIAQLLFGDISLILGMLSGLSRNYEPIQRFLTPLMGIKSNTYVMPSETHKEPEIESPIDRPVAVPTLPLHIHKVSLLSLTRGHRARREHIQKVTDIWPIAVKTQWERQDYFPTPLPKDDAALIALGAGFPKDTLYIQAARHIRERHLEKWRLIYAQMETVPILTICYHADEVLTAQALGFKYVIVCEAGHITDLIDLTDHPQRARLNALMLKTADA